MDMETRTERAEQDDGDPDDTVYVRKTRTSGQENPMYHNKAGCANFSGEDRAMTRRKAKQEFRAPCRVCVLMDVEQDHSDSMSPDDLIEAVRNAQDE